MRFARTFEPNMKRLTHILILLFALLAPTWARAECAVVYGKFWAFAFSTPAKWSSLCNADKQIGVPVAFWQEGASFSNSPAVMYVAASAKDKRTLPQFVSDSQDAFRKQAAGVKFVALDEKCGDGKLQAVQYSASGDPGGNAERICYVEGPASYFVVVLSARNTKVLETAAPAFRELLASFVPMSARIEK